MLPTSKKQLERTAVANSRSARRRAKRVWSVTRKKPQGSKPSALRYRC